MSKIRAGVIGAGSWAAVAHLPALRDRDDVEIVAVCRKGDQLLASLKQEFSVGIASEDYMDVVNQELDVIIVASPPNLHHEHAAAALRSGAHVLCEKPMTISAAQSWDLVKIAKEVKRELLVGFSWNYMPMVQQAYEQLQRKGIGELEQMSIQMATQTRELLANLGPYPGASTEQVPEQDTWTNPKNSGGGYGQAQLSHALGLAFRLQPQRVSEAFAFMSSPRNAPVELHDAISYKFSNGAIGTLSGGSSHMGAWQNKDELQVRAIGDQGQFLIDLHRECAYFWYVDGIEINMKLPPNAGAVDNFAAANALVDVALGNLEANRAPGELGALTVEALELAYQSASLGKIAISQVKN